MNLVRGMIMAAFPLLVLIPIAGQPAHKPATPIAPRPVIARHTRVKATPSPYIPTLVRVAMRRSPTP
jgi:hypothetical protein